VTAIPHSVSAGVGGMFELGMGRRGVVDMW
jgi:hypothetical protein